MATKPREKVLRELKGGTKPETNELLTGKDIVLGKRKKTTSSPTTKK